ncbi:MAG: transglycosylase SLT domain-containing protein [Vulcanimicrobiota bacterium]
MKRLLASALLLLTSNGAWARDWYAPIHEGKSYVNPNLTLARAQKHPKPRWNGQLVLWSGRLRQVRRNGQGWQMKLETPQGLVPVRCPRPVLTLKPDPREGCQVAIKGTLRLTQGRLAELEGRSIILLEPHHWAPHRTPEEFLSQWIAFHCPDEKPAYAQGVARSILAEASKHKLDPWLLASLLQVESAYRKDAVSPSGAIGLGQLMPFTAEGLGVDAWNPEENVAGCAKMLSGLLQGWNSPLDPRALALASYNAGPSLVRQLQSVPDIPETNNYVYFIGMLQAHLSRLGGTT